jgi:hypothetical protein
MKINSKPKVAIVSNARTGSDYLKAYVYQILSLSNISCEITDIVVVCDKVVEDCVLNEFKKMDCRVKIVQEISSDRKIISLDQKADQWASICNQGVEKALEGECDFILFVESDLCIPYDLVDLLVSLDLDIVAPVVFLGGLFYDSWGFRDLDGRKIDSITINSMDNSPIELSSVGSCVLFRSEIFRGGVRFHGPHETGLLVGVCTDARNKGYKVWTHPSISIIHPTSAWNAQVWRIKELNFSIENININISLNTITSSLYPEVLNPILKDIFRKIHEVESGHYSYYVEKNAHDRVLKITVSDKIFEINGNDASGLNNFLYEK